MSTHEQHLPRTAPQDPPTARTPADDRPEPTSTRRKFVAGTLGAGAAAAQDSTARPNSRTTQTT